MRQCGKIWYSERRHRHQYITAHAQCMLENWEYRYALRICITYCFFHCDNGYANVPQCYVYNYISSLVNNDIVQFALLIFQVSSPVNKQVANYNNSYSNKNNKNSKNLSAYPAELWRRPHLFQPKNKTRHNYSLSSRHLALGTKTWDVRNCKM